MNLIKQGILMTIAAFTFSSLFSYFMDGKINWISSFGIASGFLLGTLLHGIQGILKVGFYDANFKLLQTS